GAASWAGLSPPIPRLRKLTDSAIHTAGGRIMVNLPLARSLGPGVVSGRATLVLRASHVPPGRPAWSSSPTARRPVALARRRAAFDLLLGVLGQLGPVYEAILVRVGPVHEDLHPHGQLVLGQLPVRVLVELHHPVDEPFGAERAPPESPLGPSPRSAPAPRA